MDWITGLQRAINYVEEHLAEEIDYEKVAAESFSSSYHFQRVFSILCGYTLGEYIRNRRLTLAGKEYAKHFEHITIPKQTYAIFETKRCKFPTEIFLELRKQISAEWLPGSGYEIADAPEIVVTHWFFDHRKNERYRELWIPVKKVD